MPGLRGRGVVVSRAMPLPISWAACIASVACRLVLALLRQAAVSPAAIAVRQEWVSRSCLLRVVLVVALWSFFLGSRLVRRVLLSFPCDCWPGCTVVLPVLMFKRLWGPPRAAGWVRFVRCSCRSSRLIMCVPLSFRYSGQVRRFTSLVSCSPPVVGLRPVLSTLPGRAVLGSWGPPVVVSDGVWSLGD